MAGLDVDPVVVEGVDLDDEAGAADESVEAVGPDLGVLFYLQSGAAQAAEEAAFGVAVATDGGAFYEFPECGGDAGVGGEVVGKFLCPLGPGVFLFEHVESQPGVILVGVDGRAQRRGDGQAVDMLPARRRPGLTTTTPGISKPRPKHRSMRAEYGVRISRRPMKSSQAVRPEKTIRGWRSASAASGSRRSAGCVA